jgi:hypothetical protein
VFDHGDQLVEREVELHEQTAVSLPERVKVFALESNDVVRGE